MIEYKHEIELRFSDKALEEFREIYRKKIFNWKFLEFLFRGMFKDGENLELRKQARFSVPEEEDEDDEQGVVINYPPEPCECKTEKTCKVCGGRGYN